MFPFLGGRVRWVAVMNNRPNYLFDYGVVIVSNLAIIKKPHKFQSGSTFPIW